MIVHLTSNGSAEDKLRTMFTALQDQDGNDSIDATEKMFTMMDKDIDGKIIEQEFIQASLEDADFVRMLRSFHLLTFILLNHNSIQQI